MTRILFYAPEATVPVGGINVIFEIVDCLRSGGIEAHVFSSKPTYRYVFYAPEPQILYAPSIKEPRKVGLSLRERMPTVRPADLLLRRNPTLEFADGDVIVVPEIAGAWLPQQVVGHKCVLLVQSYNILAKAMLEAGWNAASYAAAVAISRVCHRMAELAGFADIRSFPLAIDTEAFNPNEQKRNVIAYMPRRRREEVEAVTTILRNRGAVADFEFVAIDNMPHDEVARIMRVASIFLSFSYQEGFGLPPAEAMAAGCIVVGFTGVGGAEYLDNEVGYPVLDGDLIDYVEKVEHVASLCRRAPDEVAQMRRRASARIAERYDSGAFRRNVRTVFGALGAERPKAA